MNFTIRTIADRGVLEKERLVLRALIAADIGDFAIFRAHAAPEEGVALSGDVVRAYWFTEQGIAAGDLVVLYTKEGTTSKKENTNGTTTHFFYWGLKEPVWTDGYVPALVSASDFEILGLGEAPSE